MSALDEGAKRDEYIRHLMSGILRSLVDGDVTVSVVSSEGFSTLEIRASAETVAVLIGVKGQMARALRTLLAGQSAKLGRRYALDLMAIAG